MDGGLSSVDASPLNYRSSNLSSSGINNPSNGYSNNNMLSTPLGRVYSSPAPPVPPRPVRNTYSSGYNSYLSPYNSYGSYGGYSPGYGGYGGYGSYGGYGGYGSYGGFGFNNYSRPGFGPFTSSYPESRFIQMAEESSRPAFQSIQSILQALGSVTMMFESSFHAIYSSYMSVLGVADNFGRLRNAFGQIFSTFAIIRMLNWLYRKLLYMLGIDRDNFTRESVWSDAMKKTSALNSENSERNKSKSWPLLLFMSVMLGGPYLMFKLMSKLQPIPVKEVWVPAEQAGSLAVALYDFHAASDQELSVNAQQKLMIAPKKFQPIDAPGWVLACNENRKIGLVPNNYIGVLMQSEKTGQTYIEHNGQTYMPKNGPGNVLGKTQEPESLSRIEEVSEIDKD